MHKESFYHFILYTLLKEGRSNLRFKIESLIIGKRKASIHYFAMLYAGCDIPSFHYIKDLFEKEHSGMILGIADKEIETDEYGLMTGRILIE